MYFIYKNETLQISNFLKENENSYFRIRKTSDNFNISFYYIEHVKTGLNLILFKNNSQQLKLELINKNKELGLWNIIETNNNQYIIQNKNKCYLKINGFYITCEKISIEESSQFSLNKIYEEAYDKQLDKKIIEKEPIDAVIKYIDLRDPLLKRKGIHQIQKDFDNEELKYCIRSILKNIPWIRKIFILMPNNKVRFFKDYSKINEKIVYVKDKDILGYESSNSLAFQFRFWKLSDFGISNNFIAMDDDYFIGMPLNKTNFFCVINGEVKPAIITSKFERIHILGAEQKIKQYKKMIKRIKMEQTSQIFRYSLYLTYLYILKLFGEPLYLPVHTHNAIPVNLKELQEIYGIIYQSNYKYSTLDSLYRAVDNIQFQTFVMCYIFLKYKRKVKSISYKLINNKDSIISKYNYSLFCINTGSMNYNNNSFMITKIVMNYLFPNPSPYELINNENMIFILFNTIFSMEKELMKYKYSMNHKIEQLEQALNKYRYQLKYFNYFMVVILIFFIFNLKQYLIKKDNLISMKK
jgi:hypothetical protein